MVRDAHRGRDEFLPCRLFLKNGDGGTPTTVSCIRLPVCQNEGMLRKKSLDPATEHPRSFSVYDADLPESLLPGFLQVIVKKIPHLTGPKRMEVQEVFNGNDNGILP